MALSGSTRVLVTGGTGFVGSHVVEMLLRQGFPVSCLVRNSSSPGWLRGMPVDIISGDCTIPESLVPAVRNAEIVIHAAGLTKARRMSDYYEVNHLGTRNILDACARYNPGIRKFVLVSSLAAAGPSADGLPVRASDPLRPVSDYGRSKAKAETEAITFSERFPVIILRPSAVYGPRDRDVYQLFRLAAKGITLETGSGDHYINPCFVEDLASGIVKAASSTVPSGSIYFIAENRTYSWKEFKNVLVSTGGLRAIHMQVPVAAAYLIGLFSEITSIFTGKPALTSRQKITEAAQKYWICDVDSTEQQLGFRHAYSLERGLQLTWNWYRQNKWLK